MIRTQELFRFFIALRCPWSILIVSPSLSLHDGRGSSKLWLVCVCERERMSQEFKKRFDTTKMSPEELKALDLEDARRSPGKGPSPGSTLHQQGAQGLSKAGRYPVVLAGVAVLTGIGTLMYYRSLNVQQIPGKANQALDSSIKPATSKSGAGQT